jgi:predicted methyltransferase
MWRKSLGDLTKCYGFIRYSSPAYKSLLLHDAFRALKPGGRFAVSDMIADGLALSTPMTINGCLCKSTLMTPA